MRLFSCVTLLLVLTPGLLGQTKKRSAPVAKAPATISYEDIYENKYVSYGRSEDQSEEYFYNPALASRTGSIVSVWTEIRTTEKPPRILAKIFFDFDCKNRMIRSRAGVRYLVDQRNFEGKLLHYVKVNDTWDTPKAAYRILVPETLAENVFVAACKL